MKTGFAKLILSAGLALAIFGCAPSADDLAASIEQGDAGSDRSVTFDLGYDLGLVISGSYATVVSSKSYRIKEGDAAPTEQQRSNYLGVGPQVSTETNSGGQHQMQVVGKTLNKKWPTDNDDIVYNIWEYLVEAQTINDQTTSVMTTVDAGSTTTLETKSYNTADIGLISMYEDRGFIWADYFGGASIWPNFGGMTMIGKRNLKTDEFWTAGSAYYRVIGKEDMTLNIDGVSKTISATKVESRAAVASGDPAADYIAECLPWNTNSNGETTASAPDCPHRVVSGTEWWYKDMLLKSEVTNTMLSVDSGQVMANPDDNDNDPGYGYEYFGKCDSDNDGVNDNDCRYFDNSNGANVRSGNADPRVDFTQVNVTPYFHFVLTTRTDTWTATDVGLQRLPGDPAAN